MKNIGCSDCETRQKGIFCELEHLALDEVSHAKSMNTYKKGYVLFQEDTPSLGLYCIKSGKIKVTKKVSNGKDSLVQIASQGDVLGHRSLFSEENYTVTATVIEETTVCFLDKDFILKSIKTQPSMAINIIQKLSKEIGLAETRTASMFQKNVRERLAELLLTFAKTYGLEDNNKIKLGIKLTREEIGSMIGATSETVIRFITEFKNEGLIEQEGKTIFVINEERLLEFANLSY